jgi:hypothetical protein
MGQIIERSVVDRRKGYLYYVDGAGNVVETKMAKGGKKGRTVCGAKKATAKKTTSKKRTAKRK